MPTPQLHHQITIGRLRANLTVARGVAKIKQTSITLERRQDDQSPLFYPAATFRTVEIDGLIQLLCEMKQHLADSHPHQPAAMPKPPTNPNADKATAITNGTATSTNPPAKASSAPAAPRPMPPTPTPIAGLAAAGQPARPLETKPTRTAKQSPRRRPQLTRSRSR